MSRESKWEYLKAVYQQYQKAERDLRRTWWWILAGAGVKPAPCNDVER
jgi:hypothetical protein